jgi:hypothetical protein
MTLQSELFMDAAIITQDAGVFNRAIREGWPIDPGTRNLLSERLQGLLDSDATKQTRRLLCEVLRGRKPRGYQKLNSLAKVCLELGVELPDDRPAPSGKPIIESRADVALVKKAIRQGWDVHPQTRQQVGAELHRNLKHANKRLVLGACEAMVRADAANIQADEDDLRLRERLARMRQD